MTPAEIEACVAFVRDTLDSRKPFDCSESDQVAHALIALHAANEAMAKVVAAAFEVVLRPGADAPLRSSQPRSPSAPAARRSHMSDPLLDDLDTVIGCAAVHPDHRGGQHVSRPCTGVRVTHRPTGIGVLCDGERSQHGNRTKAIEELRAILIAVKVICYAETP